MTYRARKGADRSQRTNVLAEVDRIFSSPDFDASRRSRDFLQFIVEETLAGRGGELTQGSIAVRVFERKDDFDPLLDPIVRIQAGRLRRSLERYYLLAGKGNPLEITVPRGSYVPSFAARENWQVGPDPAGSTPPLGVSVASLEPTTAVEPSPSLPPLEWPSVSVEGFGSAPESEDQEIATRLKEELTLELCRYRDVHVVLRGDEELLEPSHSRSSRFELRGRIRRQGGALRVTARLLDRTTGEQVWSDDYDAALSSDEIDDVARVIAAGVANEHGAIMQALAGEHRRRPMGGGGAYGAVIESHIFFFARELSEFPRAIASLRRAVADQPEVALAWAHLARLCMANYSFELTPLETPIDEACALASQAVRLDPTSTRIRCLLASALFIKGEEVAARAELDAVLRLNPHSLVYLEIVGYLLALCGDWERGIDLARTAMRRNPHHLPHVYMALWADHMRRGEFEEAHAVALDHRDPMFFWRSIMRASALGQLGRTAEARERVAELLHDKPRFPERGRTLIGHYLKQPELQETVVDGLRKAGLRLV